MADEDAPVEGAPVEGAPVEGAPVEGAPVEGAPVEGAPVEGAPVEDVPVEDVPVEEAPAEDAAGETGSPDGGSTSASGPRWRTARVAAVVAGAVLASAAAITGAVWAISAIVDDDDYYDDYGACCYEDYATAIAPEELRGAERDWGPRPDRDRGERAERRRGERLDRERGERFDRDRDRGKRAERHKRGPGKEREERYSSKEADKSESYTAESAEGCTTILSFGTGDDAVTVLVCTAPGAEWPEFEPGEGGYFSFRKLPRDAFRFFGWGGEQWPFQGRQRPFGPGPMPWDRDSGPSEDGWPFRDGRPREGGPPFDLEEFFGEGDRLSDEERAQIEQMLEMLEDFGLGGFFDGLQGFLEEFEPGFTETPTDPASATSA